MTTVRPDWKPESRYRASPDEWVLLRAEAFEQTNGLCGCGCGKRAESLGHLVGRDLGGDDVLENLLPLNGDGTRGCHGVWENRENGWEQVAAGIRGQLDRRFPSKLAYILEKKSEAFLDSYYPRALAVCPECKRPLTGTPGSDSQPAGRPSRVKRKRSDANTSYLRLRIPDDARENGREMLEALIGEARDLIGRPDWSDPYYVLVEVLAVFVRDAHKEPAGA